MNPRIRELASKALKQPDTDNDGLTVFDNDELTKFAELIVRECADVGERYADGNYEVPRQILARFGMDEDEE